MPLLALAGSLPTPAGTLRLRPQTGADEAFLDELFAAAWGLAGQLPGALRLPLLDLQRRAQRHGHATRYPAARGFLLLRGDDPVGRVLLDESPARVQIVDLALRPDCQGQGIGGALLLALAGAAAPRPLRLEVAADSRAVRLYQRLGFAVVARAPGYLRMLRAG